MKMLIALDASIHLCKGRYYYVTQVYTIMKNYYDSFGPLTICGRLKKDESLSASFIDVTDMIEEYIEIGSLYKTMLHGYNNKIRRAAEKCDIIVGRCNGIVAYRAADVAKRLKKPFYAEIMSCAWDAYWNHGIVGKLVAPYMFLKMKSVVKNADYALYVTSEFLQNRYPCKNPSVGISNVLIENVDERALELRNEKINNCDFKNITLMTTAAIDVRYKGQEYVIKAIPMLNKAGIRVKYMLVGGGDESFLRSVAKSCGVEDQVEFLGRRPLPEVFEIADKADIYVQPSLQEGLPRSVIEAMSRACPAVGAKTAGIPELISEECVVKRKSAKDIADTIIRIYNKDKMTELSKMNFERSKGYLNDILSEKRNKYYEMVINENSSR